MSSLKRKRNNNNIITPNNKNATPTQKKKKIRYKNTNNIARFKFNDPYTNITMGESQNTRTNATQYQLYGQNARSYINGITHKRTRTRNKSFNPALPNQPSTMLRGLGNYENEINISERKPNSRNSRYSLKKYRISNSDPRYRVLRGPSREKINNFSPNLTPSPGSINSARSAALALHNDEVIEHTIKNENYY